MTGRIISWALGVLITALYAYTVVSAIGNVVMLPEMAALMGFEITAFGWFWMSFGVALPVIAYALALVAGRGRSAGIRLLVLATGLCVVAAVQLEVLHLVPQSRFFG